MNEMQEYVKNVLRTESVDFPEIRERLMNSILVMCLFEVYEKLRIAGGFMDHLKRHLFYGKGLDDEVVDNLIGTRLKESNDPMTPLYVEAVGKFIGNNDDFIRLLHACMGKVTECEELFDGAMKSFMAGETPDWPNIVEEGGDGCWYDGVLASLTEKYAEVDYKGMHDLNIAKLRKRYPEKFSEDAAVNRDLEGERKVLEGGSDE